MVAAQILVASLEQGFWRASELWVLVHSLEPGFLRSSELGLVCLLVRARGPLLERASASSLDLKVVFLRLSELSAAQASEDYVCVSSLERASRLQT